MSSIHETPISVVERAYKHFLSARIEYRPQESFFSQITSPGANFPPKLFHYTGGAGLKGILTSKSLWFTDYRYVNDSSELTFGFECVAKSMPRLQKELDPLTIQALSLAQSAVQLGTNCYVACFCEDDDVLTQWHGYGNKGTGYAIGFEGSDLTQIVPHIDVIPGPVHYGEEKAIQGLEAEMLATSKAVQDTLARFTLNDKEKEDLSNRLRGQVIAATIAAASFIKNEKFEIEHEWRLVTYRGNTFSSEDELQFRLSGDLLVPYIPVKLCYPNTDILPLSLIRLGPTVPERAIHSVRALIQEKISQGVSKRHVEVLPSDIPLQT